MNFEVIRFIDREITKPDSKVYLVVDNWNDYSFYTTFEIYYVDQKLVRHKLGFVRIGFYGQEKNITTLSVGDTFNKLEDKYFSLGYNINYYKALQALEPTVKDTILKSLNDIAFNPDIYDRAIQEPVTKASLLRDVSPTTVTGQFRRMAHGGAELTNYSFNFENSGTNKIELEFEVLPESMPPTNIHVLIGRNGVGKTYILNQMLHSLNDTPKNKPKYGQFRFANETLVPDILDKGEYGFANLISVSFSAFDENEPQKEQRDPTKGIRYSYIGLKNLRTQKEKFSSTKGSIKLRNEFYNSLIECKTSPRSERWEHSINMLESDPNFKDANISKLLMIEDSDELKEEANEIFKNLSSGHKIVLLTITRLVETLQEKSLVLLDEPESHLHPPLLSAFTRALSELLVETNGVAIIATHSPVVLQEVPKSCVWKLRRSGQVTVADRLQIESFGENVGILTNEIFGLEVTQSGYYQLLLKTSKSEASYEERIALFSNQLGSEARAILISINGKNNNEEH